MADEMPHGDVYYRLRQYLDELPAGYPETPTGVEIRLLEKIFAPEEAELFLHCKLVAETPAAIAERAGMPESEAAAMLARMGKKGHLFPVESGGRTLYMALPWMPGIIETQLNLLDEEFAHMLLEHNKTYFPSWTALNNQMFRVVPVNSAVEATPVVETYDRIRELVKEQKQISVMPCLCRSTQRTLGHDCGRPLESCFVFGPYTKHFVENGDGRYISVDEALDILDECEKAALVLQPVNARELNGMCTCCSCCCFMLQNLKNLPNPAEVVQSSFQAKIEPGLCSLCGSCLERCQTDALVEGESSMEVDLARCIGCGLCVSSCPEGAISLFPKGETREVPTNVFDTLTRIARERNQPFGKFNFFMKHTSSPAFFRNWKLLDRIGLARPIVKQLEKRGFV
jgi:Na+-translocating ferredoxin:NAD+ oxidoreductase subunit B